MVKYWPILIGQARPVSQLNWLKFKKQLVDVQDFKKITHHFRRIYRIYPNLIIKKLKDVNM